MIQRLIISLILFMVNWGIFIDFYYRFHNKGLMLGIIFVQIFAFLAFKDSRYGNGGKPHSIFRFNNIFRLKVFFIYIFVISFWACFFIYFNYNIAVKLYVILLVFFFWAAMSTGRLLYTITLMVIWSIRIKKLRKKQKELEKQWQVIKLLEFKVPFGLLVDKPGMAKAQSYIKNFIQLMWFSTAKDKEQLDDGRTVMYNRWDNVMSAVLVHGDVPTFALYRNEDNDNNCVRLKNWELLPTSTIANINKCLELIALKDKIKTLSSPAQ